MKKILLSLFFIPTFVAAGEFTVKDFSSGMHSNPSENVIPDNGVALSQNFYTDIPGYIQERNGYEKRDSTVLGGTKPVIAWAFTDSNLNEWIISFSSRTFYKNTFGNTPTQFGPQMTVAQIPDCASNLGKFVCTNGTDQVWSFDGASTAAISGAPLGKRIEAWRTRFVIGNITNAQTTLRFSADGDATSWTLGGLSTDPFSLLIGGANSGEYIRCMRNYLDDLIVSPKTQTWKISGFDQSDVEVRNVSKEIGCIDDGSMREWDNSLMFMSTRGLEEMRGITIANVSDPVRNLTDIVVKNTQNQRANTQTSSMDWGNGRFDNTVYVDTETSSGSIQLTFPDNFDSFRDGTAGSKNVWTSYCRTGCSSTASSSNGKLSLATTAGVAGQTQVVRTTSKLFDYKQGTTYYLVISSITADPTNNSLLTFVVSSSATITGSPTSLPDYFYFEFRSTTAGSAYLSGVKNSSDLHICNENAFFSPTKCQIGQTAFPIYASIFLATTTYRVTINGSTATVGSHTYTNQATYSYLSLFGQLSTNNTALVDTFGVAPASFTFTSSTITVGSLISSWGPVRITDTKTQLGTITYSFDANASSSSFTSYTTIANGGTPTDSLVAYASWKAAFRSFSATDTTKLDDFTVTWFEGNAPDMTSSVYDKRYWLSFTTNTATNPYNDIVLLYQRNRTFSILKGINAASFCYPLWRDYLYFGNSDSTGYVYKFDVGNSDDGNNITSILKTKSYDLDAFIREKDFRYVYSSYLGNTGFTGSFSMAYDLDRSGNAYSLGSANLNDGTGQLIPRFHFPMSNPLQGREIQYTLTKNGAGDRLKLYGFTTNYEVKEER